MFRCCARHQLALPRCDDAASLFDSLKTMVTQPEMRGGRFCPHNESSQVEGPDRQGRDHYRVYSGPDSI